MSILSERVIPEVMTNVVNTVGLTSSNVITLATKWERFDWRSLLEFIEQTQPGITPPWVIIRQGPTQAVDWGMQNQCLNLPLEIFYVNALRNAVASQTSTTGNGVVKTMSTTAGMFSGQRLWFVTTGVFGIISTVDSATQITLESAITTVSEQAYSDIVSDVEVLMEKLRRIFSPLTTFTNFQIVEEPETDVSDINPANEYYGKDGFPLFAGSCFAQLLVGETY